VALGAGRKHVFAVANMDEPEHGVVFREAYVKDVVERCGLQIVRLWRGSRFGQDDPDHNPNSQQDIIIAAKS
jgi:hypothetical protein